MEHKFKERWSYSATNRISVCAVCGTIKDDENENSKCMAVAGIGPFNPGEIITVATDIHVPSHDNGSVGCGAVCEHCGGNSLACGCR